MGKVDALLDVGLETLDSLAQELLLPLGDALQGVGDLFDTVGLRTLVNVIKIESSRISTYSKLNRDREEVDASSLGDGLTAGNTRQVDVAGLNKALFALGSAEHLFGESEGHVSICSLDGRRKAM